MNNLIPVAVSKHIDAYRDGQAGTLCPRTWNAEHARSQYQGFYVPFDAAYIAEWDRQCLQLRRAMFCRRIA